MRRELRRTSPNLGEIDRWEKGSRPLSRVLSWAVIPLGCASPRTSSDLPGSHVGHMSRRLRAARFPIWSCSRWGLPCRACYHARGALLPHHFTLTVSAFALPLWRRLGGIFLLHFPWAHAPQVLPGTLPDGARTFLHVLLHTATAWPTLRPAPYAGIDANATPKAYQACNYG